MCDKREYTDKVIKFLDNNMDMVKGYFDYCVLNFKKPNYSEMCRKYLAGGTVGDKVYFSNSVLIDRSAVTSWLRDRFESYVTVGLLY